LRRVLDEPVFTGEVPGQTGVAYLGGARYRWRLDSAGPLMFDDGE
jgi:hypothetical protein